MGTDDHVRLTTEDGLPLDVDMSPADPGPAWTWVGDTEGGVTLQPPIKWHLVHFLACDHRAWVPSETVAQHIMAQSTPMTCPACDVVSNTWRAWSDSWLRKLGGTCRKCGEKVTLDQAGNLVVTLGSVSCEGDSMHRLEDDT